ncbi:MAG TPA: 50S ribosomal protein L1 [Patescibacteria group bacterium]|jgi:large subunit ribosomal protein L1|nr:50S ribosomal protein L1 [Patescibacteria group bacterium]
MGKRLTAARKEVDISKKYEIAAAVELVKKTATTKFVGNIEVHARLGIDPKKSDEVVRGTVNLPFGTGKSKRIAAFVTEGKEKEAKDAGATLVGGDDLIKKIKETGKLDFDVAIAEPSLMAKLASIAKILGPRGLMPNPKSGTVTPDVGRAVKEFATGKLEFKNDESGNIHLILGKTDFENDKILANYKAFMDALMNAKPSGMKKEFVQTMTLHATMGPAVKIAFK